MSLACDNSYTWQPDYEAAVLDTTRGTLAARVAKARETIVARRVSLYRGGADDKEIHELDQALRTLRLLQNDLIG